MASGQLENELTVTVRYPDGKMRVNIHEVLARTGARRRRDRTLPDGTVEHGYGVDYPLSYCRKLFRFMVRWLEQDVLEQVDQFIKNNNEKLYGEWVQQRELGGR